jgi:hypothetical protein
LETGDNLQAGCDTQRATYYLPERRQGFVIDGVYLLGFANHLGGAERAAVLPIVKRHNLGRNWYPTDITARSGLDARFTVAMRPGL